MNFYDKVHEMIRCLKDTPEYTEYMQAKALVKKDKNLDEKINSFRKFQKTEQLKYIKGEKLNADDKTKLSEMYTEIIKSELGIKFFQAEIKLDVMLTDMQKIISDGIQEIVEY